MPELEIRGREYEIPTRFRVCDPVLIKDVTGMGFQEFAESIDNPLNDGMVDPVALAGLIAVAIWQKFPTWPRHQVVRYVQELGEEDWKIVGVEIGPEDDVQAADPTTEPVTTEVSADSLPSSSSDSAPSTPESQPTSGDPTSPDGSPALPPNPSPV
jgi:hypothetical protein